MDHQSLKYIFSQRDLNFHHHRWKELLKDYDYTIQYQPGPVNVVADALSQKSFMLGTCQVVHLETLNVEFPGLKHEIV